jgi:16S rRNA (guanine527-N7)-methyltransferase
VKQDLDRYAKLLRTGPHGLLSAHELKRVDDHVADALVAVDWLRDHAARALVDVGTGGGLPGIPVAIALPELTVTLVETLGWKCEFLRACTRELGLEPRVRVVQDRAEVAAATLGRESFDVATARALAAPGLLLEYLSPFVRPGGHVLAYSTAEHGATDLPRDVLDRLGLTTPMSTPAPSSLRDEGLLVAWRKVAPCDAAIPRRPGMARKRPLA